MNNMKRLIMMAAIAIMMPHTLKDSTAEAQTHSSEVMLETTEGNIRIALYDETPLHRDNFIRLADGHAYDSLLFHRVIAGFMIQGGDPESRNAHPGQTLGEGSVGETIPAEIRIPAIYHKRGAVAMAREGDDVNPEHRSGGSQFYIVWGRQFTADELNRINQQRAAAAMALPELTTEMLRDYSTIGGTPHLDGGYTVFGEVTEGLDIVERIQQCATDDNDRPIQDVRILRATVVER